MVVQRAVGHGNNLGSTEPEWQGLHLLVNNNNLYSHLTP